MNAEATALTSNAVTLTDQAINLSNTAAGFSNSANAFKYAGAAVTIGGCVIGIAVGAYFTHKFCEELIDKFVDFYKNNKGKIRNSYQDALEYFSLKNKTKRKC